MNRAEHQFTNIEPLSVSGMYCRLFKALRFNQWWVLKTLKPEFAHDQMQRNALYKEYKIARSLDYQFIVKYFSWEYVPELGCYCIVQEYVQGVTLDQYFRRPDIGVKEMYKVFMELAFALRYCAQQQVVHRDVKPTNVMITDNGKNVKLIDFGLSDRPDFSILKMPAGTRRYMAPEQAVKGAMVDYRSDMYALGKIMRRYHVPRRFDRISKRCIEHDPGKRYQSYDDLIHDLKESMNLFRIRLRTFAAVALLLTVAIVGFGLGFGQVGGYLLGYQGEKEAYNGVPWVYYLDTVSYADAARYTCMYVPRYQCKIHTLRPEAPIPGPIGEDEAVDLGLSVKWAPFNLGCDHESLLNAGSLVGFGDVQGNLTSTDLSLYGKGTITPDADIVRQHWHGRWRMPTVEEFRELVNKCQWRIVDEQGHPPCFVVTGPNGNSIVMNTTGYRYLANRYEALYVGYYWTADYGSDRYGDEAAYFSFSADNYRFGEQSTCYGLAIRPVLDYGKKGAGRALSEHLRIEYLP